MSDQDLYAIAAHHVDRRNRRWKIWSFDLAGLIMTVAALILLSGTPYQLIAVGVMIAWAGVFTLHTILASMAQSRDEDIEKEVVKLKTYAAQAAYEKPKRLNLTEDGELDDYTDDDYEEQGRSLKA